MNFLKEIFPTSLGGERVIAGAGTKFIFASLFRGNLESAASVSCSSFI